MIAISRPGSRHDDGKITGRLAGAFLFARKQRSPLANFECSVQEVLASIVAPARLSPRATKNVTNESQTEQVSYERRIS
jgi:hypothetical protein